MSWGPHEKTLRGMPVHGISLRGGEGCLCNYWNQGHNSPKDSLPPSCKEHYSFSWMHFPGGTFMVRLSANTQATTFQGVKLLWPGINVRSGYWTGQEVDMS